MRRHWKLDVTQQNFESERAVVQEEFRRMVLASPYGQFEYALQTQSFAVHPYKRPTIGRIEDLDGASLADVQAFHRTYYRPDNATLVVIGDFEPALLDGWVAQDFGRIERPTESIPRASTVQPVRAADQRAVVRAPNVPLPAVGLTWLAPIAPAELQRVKVRLFTSALAARETNEGKGHAIGGALTQTGAAAAVNTELALLQAVTAEDVQRVVQTYLMARPKVVVEYVGDAARAAEDATKFAHRHDCDHAQGA